MDNNEAKLLQLIGLADLCELSSALFSYPDKNVADGLVGGAIASDMASCLSDAGADADDIDRSRAFLEEFGARDEDELLDALKKGSSLIFFAPGYQVPVWPYEAPFKFVASGKEGVPTLFRAPVTLDVERQMKEAGVRARNDRKIPCDSVWAELGFLNYLLANAAEALRTDDAAGCEKLMGRARLFWDTHAGTWLPAFMTAAVRESQVEAHSYGREYQALGEVGSIVCSVLGKSLGER